MSVYKVDDVIAYYSSLEDTSNVFFLNYEETAIAEDQSNFYNYMHLNDGGARKLTGLLALELMQIL